MSAINRIRHVEQALTHETVNRLKARADAILGSVHQSYFPKLSEREFRSIYQRISVVARVVSVRFGLAALDELRELSTPFVKKAGGEGNWVLCPLFTLRYYYPDLPVSPEHEAALLQTEPHYDNGFGNAGISIWIPFHDVGSPGTELEFAL